MAEAAGIKREKRRTHAVSGSLSGARKGASIDVRRVITVPGQANQPNGLKGSKSQEADLTSIPWARLCTVPAAVSPLRDSPPRAPVTGAKDMGPTEAEEDVLSIASSMPALEPNSDAEEAEEAGVASHVLPLASSIKPPPTSESAPPTNPKPTSPPATVSSTPGLGTTAATPEPQPRIEFSRQRVPKLATIVVSTQTCNYVDGIVIHRETKQRTYLQDVYVDCTSVFTKKSIKH